VVRAATGGLRRIAGVLLAAGGGERFGGAKLAAPLASGPQMGVAVGVAACRNLRRVLDVVAVVRPGDEALASMLAGEGARVVVAARAAEGMGASLAAGIAAAGDVHGYVVALADMPWIAPATIRAVAEALIGGASIAAPRHRGRRGHPVGFAAAHRDALVALGGDEGARSILDACAGAVRLVDVDDPGILRDVDVPDDLR
jgi:molybdenum cofactor cytidylyltransferase